MPGASTPSEAVTGVSTSDAAVVLVVSEHGRCSADHDGSPLATELDRRAVPWLDVSVTGLEAAFDDLSDHVSVAVAVIGAIGDEVVGIAARDGRVAALVLVNSDVGADTCWLLGRWENVPVIAVADAGRPQTLEPAVRAFRACSHPDADLEVVTPVSFDDEDFGESDSPDAVFGRVVERILATFATLGSRRDVAFTTDDGWEIHGTLTVPSRPHRVPVAVLLHSGRSDRAVFVRLAGLLARLGVASLNLDWRGRGLSQNRATYFQLSTADRAEGWRDAAAAMAFLTDRSDVDADRVAMIGVVHGAEHAVAAAVGDPRIRMLGVLTGFVPRNDDERRHLTSGDVEVLYVSCTGHGPVTGIMRQLVATTPPGRATLRVYPGGAIGYQLFSVDARLEDDLARWVAAGLAGEVAS